MFLGGVPRALNDTSYVSLRLSIEFIFIAVGLDILPDEFVDKGINGSDGRAGANGWSWW